MANKKPLSPTYTRKDFETQAEYEEYLAIEKGEFNPPFATKAQRKEAAQIATNTIEKIAGKKFSIGLCLPARDIQRLKSTALQRGIPYQTFIGSILYQYLDGNLTEK